MCIRLQVKNHIKHRETGVITHGLLTRRDQLTPVIRLNISTLNLHHEATHIQARLHKRELANTQRTKVHLSSLVKPVQQATASGTRTQTRQSYSTGTGDV